jgi:Na+-driven multidrug efflux pump
VLFEATSYIEIFFGGAVVPWLMNTLTSILRGTGNMKLPAALTLLFSVIQIVLGGALGLGIGPIPQFGMPGIACGTLIAFATSASISGWYLFSGRGRLNLAAVPFKFRGEMFLDILKVGAVACFSPLQSVLTITIFTHMLARFGNEVLAGYGIGTRLEFMLTSIAFAVGMASVPMVGMAVGAGRIQRARQVAWSGGAFSFVSIAAVGIIIAVFPWLWVGIFTDDPGVRAASYQYLAIAAPPYAFIGLNISLYFSSQGAAKIIGPVLSQTARLIFIAVGGIWLMSIGATVTSFFVLAACSMVLHGLLCATAVKLTSWDVKAETLAQHSQRRM